MATAVASDDEGDDARGHSLVVHRRRLRPEETSPRDDLSKSPSNDDDDEPEAHPWRDRPTARSTDLIIVAAAVAVAEHVHAAA
eukprot:CAMPEP_0185700914 /NCGR_PEP_ID=MMETSP1164-20130828/8024_1 /TAXON_ID=1104430 /ORGANISM="Chrysoreinhardia sp, Strain CCMP2950" /LENGTH=82 /DNA_ID=CAMNT_0028367877 /DNA_START=78 /DNA_END=324 /DNA_ORIENTATION=-